MAFHKEDIKPSEPFQWTGDAIIDANGLRVAFMGFRRAAGASMKLGQDDVEKYGELFAVAPELARLVQRLACTRYTDDTSNLIDCARLLNRKLGKWNGEK